MLMTSKIGAALVIAMAAMLSMPAAADAASRRTRTPPSGETGYTNPSGCLGGGCTSENPDRVRQPCSGGSCYKRTRTTKSKSHKSSEVVFELICAG
jgi:hypothetical protein